MKNLSVLFMLFMIATTVQCQNWWKNGIRGEGPVVNQEFDLEKFDGVSLHFSGDLYLKQGNTQNVRIEGQQNIIDNITTEVRDGIWKIRFDRPVRKHERVKVYVTIPHLTLAKISGSGDIYGEGRFTSLEALQLGISGSGNINMDMDATEISAKISGSGDMDLSGQTNGLEIKISGSGDINAYDLKTQKCRIQISGSGDCKLNVVDDLEARISGSGDVEYKGRPRISTKISGSGDLIARS